jgi:hypothetical protein
MEKVVKVQVLLKCDSYDRTEILGVFATVEVAKTIAEAEEPGRNFDWDDAFGSWNVHCGSFPRPIYQYTIEEYEVREK